MADAVAPVAPIPSRPLLYSGEIRRIALVGAVILLLASFSVLDDHFFSLANLGNIATQASYLSVFACAQMLVLLIRGFDLSLGHMVSVTSVISALFATGAIFESSPGVLAAMAVLAGLGVALLVGAFNGIGVGYFGLNPFVVSLGSLNICLGVASMVSGGRPVGGVPSEFSRIFYGQGVFGISVPIMWAVALSLILHVVLKHTRLGRFWYFIGGNPRAASVAGVSVKKMVLSAYLGCSLLGALGALMLTARTASGEPNLGGDLTLQSAAAAAIGGVSLRGGKGGVAAAVLGAVFITVLSNGMNLLQVNGYLQELALGLLIVFAATIGGQWRRV